MHLTWLMQRRKARKSLTVSERRKRARSSWELMRLRAGINWVGRAMLGILGVAWITSWAGCALGRPLPGPGCWAQGAALLLPAPGCWAQGAALLLAAPGCGAQGAAVLARAGRGATVLAEDGCWTQGGGVLLAAAGC